MRYAITLGIALSLVACDSVAPQPDAAAPDSGATLDATPSCSSLTCDRVCRDPFVPRDLCVVGSATYTCVANGDGAVALCQ